MLDKLNEEQKKVRTEVKERLIGYILAALGLVAGLAWNDAIRTTIERFIPVGASGDIVAKFIYALVLTVFVAVFAYYISRLIAKDGGTK